MHDGVGIDDLGHPGLEMNYAAAQYKDVRVCIQILCLPSTFRLRSRPFPPTYGLFSSSFTLYFPGPTTASWAILKSFQIYWALIYDIFLPRTPFISLPYGLDSPLGIIYFGSLSWHNPPPQFYLLCAHLSPLPSNSIYLHELGGTLFSMGDSAWYFLYHVGINPHLPTERRRAAEFT